MRDHTRPPHDEHSPPTRRKKSRIALAGLLLGTMVAGLLTVLPATAPAAQATVPTPGATEAVISVKVGGVRQPDGTVAGVQGVRLSLYGAGTASSSGQVAAQGAAGARYNPAWSWSTCVSDAQGDCNFIIPLSTVTTGTPSATSVPLNTRFWVAQDPGDASPSGYYSNPQSRLGGSGATPEYTFDYRFRTGPLLRRGATYLSTAPMNATDALDADLGFMRNRMANNAEGLLGANINRSTGVWNQSIVNPPAPAQCGLTVAVVFDTSASLGAVGIAQAKAALGTFVDAFRGTPTQMSLFSYSSVSPGVGATNHPALLPVTTAAQANIYKAQYAGWTASGGTNWDRGFAAAANSGNSYDLVVMMTDGNPTVYSTAPGSGSSAFNSNQDIDAGIFSANQLKAAGSRIVALGVGTAVNSPASALNLRAVSGTVDGSDYIRVANFDQAGQTLADLARANCEGTIEVQKMIVPSGGTTADAVPAPAGWEFSATAQAPSVSVNTPAGGVATTDGTGLVSYGLGFTNPSTSGPIQILETQQSGYTIVPVGTGADARNASCVNSETGAAVAITDAGSAATPGFTVTGQESAVIRCTVYNTQLAPGFTLTKTSNPVSGSTVNPGDTITYTVTGTNTGDGALNPVTINDDLSEVLNNATLTGTPTATSGTPSVTGNQLTWTGSLAAGASVTITYTVTINANAAPGVILKNRVVGSATPPTGPPIEPPPVTTEHPTPGFTISKTSDPVSGTAVAAGSTITYTVTGTNTGATPLSAVALTDDLSDVLNNATLTGTPTASLGAAPALNGTTLSWNGTLAAGESVVLSYTVTLNATVPAGTIINNVVTGTATPPTGPPIVPPPVETEHPVPGFTLTKTADPASGTTVRNGDTITYTVTGTNTGATVLNPATITDDLSQVLNNAALTAGPTASAGTVSVTGTTLSWNGTLAVGASVTITYTVTVNVDAAPGILLTNVVTGSATPPNGPAIVPPPVSTEHPTPGFTLTKTADPASGTTVTGGDTITYTVTATNTGRAVLDPASVTDDLSAVLNNASLTSWPTSTVTPAPFVSGNTIQWNGVLQPGQSVVITYTVTIDADVEPGVVVRNSASGTATPPTGPPIVPPPVTTEHPTPGFTLTKTSDPASGSTVRPGDTITYTVTGTNTGASVLDPATISDDLSEVLNNASVTTAPAATTGTVTLNGSALEWAGSLAAGASVTITYTVTVNADAAPGAILTNVVTGSATPPTGPPIVPPPVTTEHPTPGFALTKTSDPISGSTVTGGDTITYTVTGTNTGASVLDPATINDDLSQVLNNAEITTAPAASSGTVTLTGTDLAWTGSLAAGASVTITYTVTVNADVEAGTIIQNNASGSATPPTGPPIVPPPVVTEHPTPGFTLTKTSDPESGTSVQGGDTITYTVTGTNTGAAVLDPASINDDLAEVLNNATVTTAPAATSGTVTLTGTDLAWTGSLAAGASVTITYTVTINADVVGGTIIRNSASGSATPPTGPPIVPPPVVTEHPVPGFTLTKSSDPASGTLVRPGDSVTYTVVGTNTGATVLNPATIADDLSGVLNNATLQGAASASTGAAPTFDGTTLNWSGILGIGESVTLSYTVTVNATVPDNSTLHNVVTGSATPPTGPPIVPPPATAEHPIPGFTLTKTSDPVSGTTVRAGDTITYTVIGTNSGATVLDPASISDDLSEVLNNATITVDPAATSGTVTLVGTALEWTGALAVGESVTITYTVTVNDNVAAGTLVRNTASGTATPPTGPPIVPPTVITENPTPGFTLTKSADPASGSTVSRGDSVTYTVTGTNTGATVLNDVVITDDLSNVLNNATLTGTPTASLGAAPTLSGTTLSWSGTLAVGESVVLSYTVKINETVPDNTTIKNVVTGTATPPTGPPIVPPPAVTEHPVPGFTVVKTSDPKSGSTVTPGTKITYTVVGTNTGATVLDPVTLTDDLKDVLAYAALEGNPTASSGLPPVRDGNTLKWSGSLAVGESVTLTYTVIVNANASGKTLHNIVVGVAQPPGEQPPLTPPPAETKHPVETPGSGPLASTGSMAGIVLSLGALLLAMGAAVVYFSRRRNAVS